MGLEIDTSPIFAAEIRTAKIHAKKGHCSGLPEILESMLDSEVSASAKQITEDISVRRGQPKEPGCRVEYDNTQAHTDPAAKQKVGQSPSQGTMFPIT